MELLKYLFFILDSEKNGSVTFVELKAFILSLWGEEVLGNVMDAVKYLESLDEGRADFNYRG